MREIELKFIIPQKQLNAVKKRMQVKTAKHHQLDAYYFDTPQQLLGKRGIALRIRNENGQWVQTLKAHLDGLTQRIEENIVINSQSLPKVELGLFSQATQKLLANIMDLSLLEQALVVKFSTQVARITRLVSVTTPFTNENPNTQTADKNLAQANVKNPSDSKANQVQKHVVEIAFDIGRITSGDLEQDICEIEFELQTGSIDFLITTCQAWVAKYGLHYSTLSKAGAGSRLFAKGHATTQASPVVMSTRKQFQPTKDVDSVSFLKQAIQNCLLHILPNFTDLATFAENNQPNNTKNVFFSAQVHQSRVGLRRLRTLLAYAHKFDKSISTSSLDTWQSELKAVFGVLGNYRDKDIIIKHTQPNLQLIGAPNIVWQTPCQQTVALAVTKKSLQQVLLSLIHYASQSVSLEVNPVASNDKKTSIKPPKKAINTLDGIIHKQFNRIAKQSDAFLSLGIEEQHEVRKQLKKLRYICEFAKPLHSGNKKQVKTFLTYLKPAQETLGKLNDASVAKVQYQTLSKNNPDAYFAVGYFTAIEKQLQTECATAIQTLKFAPKFW